MASHDIPVLIVGGGPVGLALALDLGWRGVPCLMVEQGDGQVVDAKMFATGIRTVEFCRRWGIADKVRHWGFPDDFPFDNVFTTGLQGHEIGRIPMPAQKDIAAFPQSPENFAHCPQFVFDPILVRATGDHPSIALRYRCRLKSFRDDGDGVLCTLVDEATGAEEEIRAGWLIGCDGFSSTVRKALGIAMEGTPLINRSINVMFRAPALWARHDKGKAGRYVIIGEEGAWGSLTAADGVDLWRLMIQPHADAETLDAEAELRRALGEGVPFEIVKVGHWVRRRMVAADYGRGRVWIAGDAAHVMPPNGGLGMNTGIGDAVDLGWKLAAMHQGWGGPNLLASYEAERRLVGIRQCDEAMENFERYGSHKPAPHVTEETAAGEAARAAIGRRLASANAQAWENPLNTHLGYRYAGSPIVVPDGALPPEPEDSRLYEQSSHAGCRAPHAWLADGRSTLDLFGRGFVLLRLGAAAPDAAPLADAARRRGMPLEVVSLAEPELAALYERALVLVRPDGHVAWRGDALPPNPLAVVDTVRGAGVP
ncbi:MAG TPA: FAD-dependent monooxygenase [Hyphomicrobiales bacterium]|nr:FAD-dependent monooxygenase [Hyphomicrobiales bacterium]